MLGHTRKLKLTIIFALVLVIIALGLYLYNGSLHQSLSDSTCKTLAEIMNQQKFSFHAKIQGEISVIKSISSLVTDILNSKVDRTSLMQALKNATDESGFNSLIIANLEGQTISNEDIILNIADEEYFNQALSGNTFISDPHVSKINNKKEVIFSTPIVSNGEIIAVLIGAYGTEELDKLFVSSFGGSGYAYICTLTGELVASTIGGQHETIWDIADRMTVLKHDKFSDIEISMLKGELGGHSVFVVDEEMNLMHYSPLGINGWYIFSIVPDSVISLTANSISQSALYLTSGIILLFIGIIAYLSISQKKYADNLYKTAYFDELTGVPNRAKFKIDAKSVVKSNPDKKFITIMVDMRQFKVINELFDFAIGDEVIIKMAAALKAISDPSLSAFARIYADKFVMLQNYQTLEDIQDKQQRFEREFLELVGDLGSHRLEFRYGRYFIEDEETDFDGILQKVNLAHSIAKGQKHSDTCDYNDEFKQRVVEESKLEDKMDKALLNNEFKVYLQPKYLLESGTVVGAEALVRWQQEDGTFIMPNKFIPLFEKNGFITKLDMYMFEKVCQIIRKWIDLNKPIVTVSVNFSRLHLQNPNFVAQIEAVANKYQIPKEYLEIELTESTIFKNEDVLENIISRLHDIGFTLSMDDFGTGYSSLGLLKNLPVDVIKIDRGFFVSNKYKTRTKTVISNVMKMAKELGINTVAEGIETQEQIDFLREVGCDIVQGFYYSKPLPATDFSVNKTVEPAISKSDINIDISELNFNIDKSIPVIIYRLFQASIRKTLLDKYGEGEMLEVFGNAGKIAGGSYVNAYFDISLTTNGFIDAFNNKLNEHKLGQIDVEYFDASTGIGSVVFKDYLESAVNNSIGKTLSKYIAGFITGVLKEYTKKNHSVLEAESNEAEPEANLCKFTIKPR